MRIGYCTGFSEDEVAWASRAGFTTLEIGYIDAGEDAWKRARDAFERHNLRPMSVFHYADYGDPDPSRANEAVRQARRVMQQCLVVGAPVYACNAFAGHAGTPKEKLANFKRIFSPLAQEAGDLGLKIAIENCPHHLHNVAWSPVMWEAMFNEVPHPAIGLEYDPSHLVWMSVDYVAALAKFADRVYAFHAKDTEVFRDRLTWGGIYGERWWRYRIPGWGEIDWKKLLTILWERGYPGDIAIEHEDPVFRDNRRREGLTRGLEHLRGLIEAPAA